MRRFALVLPALLVGCNAILDIPERTLLEDDATSADTSLTIDSAALPDTNVAEDSSLADATTDIEPDSPSDEVAIDSSGTDSSGTDSSGTDSSGTDSTTPDTAMADSAADTRDSAAADTSGDTATDAGSDTSTPTCGVTGKPCCGSTPAICDTNSVCSSGTCIASAGSCVRATDCPGVCTGPAICAGAVCFSCGASAGAGLLWDACTTSSNCKNGPCDRTRGVCSSACAPGITADADCTSLDPKAVCVAPTLTVTSGSTTATGRVGFCARSCQRDGDCRMTETCRGTSNDISNRIDVVCSPSPMGAMVDLGGTCTTSSDCKKGSCLTFGSTSKCTAYCATSADCTAGTWNTCGPATFTRPAGGTQIVQVCTP